MSETGAIELPEINATERNDTYNNRNDGEDNEEEPLFGENFKPEEEEILDRKYQSSWTPQFMNNDPKWRCCGRVSICLVAVCLLWLTSLRISEEVAGLWVVSPPYEDVVDQWTFVAELSENERLASNACVERQLDQCFERLETKSNEKQQESYESAAYNTQQLILRDIFFQRCLGVHYRTLGTTGLLLEESAISDDTQLKQLVENGLYDTANCQPQEIDSLKKIMQDNSQSKSDIYAADAEYSRESLGSFERITDAIALRVQYDRDYTANKTQAIGEMADTLHDLAQNGLSSVEDSLATIQPQIDHMRNCLQPGAPPPPPGSDPCPYNATEMYLDMQNQVNLELEGLSKELGDIWDDVNADINRATAYIDGAAAILQQISGFLDDITTIIPGVDLAIANLGEPPNLASLPRIPDVPSVPNIDVTFDSVGLDQVYDDMSNHLDSVTDEVNDAVGAVSGAVDDIASDLETPFDDYNPPDINLTAQNEQSDMQDRSDAFLEKQKRSLGEFDSTGAVFKDATNRTLDDDFTNFNFSTSPAAFVGAGYTQVPGFQPLLDSIDGIAALLVNADIIYRVIRTAMTIMKYLAMSEVGLPVVDVRKFKASKKRNYQMILMKCATHPYCFLAFGLIVMIFMLTLLAGFYVPMYIAYNDGCVTQTNPDGTFLTNTSYAFAFNWAASDYNTGMLEGVAQYDEKRTAECSVNTKESTTNYTATREILLNIEGRIERINNEMILYEKCILNSPALNQYIVDLNISTTAPFDPDEILDRQTCVSDATRTEEEGGGAPTLRDSRYNCSDLPLCNMTCAGPDEEALAAATLTSGCASEWMFHAGMFKFVMSLLVYLCLNTSRVLIVLAMVRLMWRVLGSKGFEFKGTVDRLGNMDGGAPERLKKQLDQDIRKYERVAWIMLFCSVLAHIPYLVVLQEFGDSI